MYDLLILGGGPAGYHSALKATKKGLSVALIEKKRLGGVCLNEGCIPSKTILHSSKMVHDFSHFTPKESPSTVDLAGVQQRKRAVVQTLAKALQKAIQKTDITLFEGEGVLTESTPQQITIIVNGKKLVGKNLICATGSSPIIPNISGIDSPKVVTSEELLQQESTLSSLLIIGGGIIGLEMATFFAEIGTKVTIIETSETIAPTMEKEVIKVLATALKKKSITILTSTTVTAITETGVLAQNAKGEMNLEAEKILLSVGRRANGDFLKEWGILVDNGAVITDKRCRTNYPNIFACGDVNGKQMLAHTAYREAEIAIDAILGKESSIKYTTIPTIIYTHPEVASVGLTTKMALHQGVEVVEKKRPFGGNGRFLAETERERGLCKVVLGMDGTILGVHLVGIYASELITTATLLVELKVKASQLESIIFPHPTMSEIIKETIVED